MSRHWIEAALEIANIQYYEDHLKKEMEMKPVKDEGSIPVPQDLKREKGLFQLYAEWCSAERQADELCTEELRAAEIEAFNLLVSKIQTEADKYGIEYSIENLSDTDGRHRIEVINKINDQYGIEEENAEEQRRREEEIDRAEYQIGDR